MENNALSMTTGGGGIRRENLDRRDYANTLAAEAIRAGVMSEDDLGRIRTDMMHALAEIIGLATGGESSSVKTDSARQYMKSLLYNIDTYLFSLGSPEEAAELLRTRRMTELYGKGYQINKKHWEDARHLWGRVRYTRLRDADESYNKTVDVYFRNYLSTYDPRTSAHDKIYLSMPRYGIRGAFHIDGAAEVLKKLLALNEGKPSDVVIDGSQKIAGFYRAGEEPNS